MAAGWSDKRIELLKKLWSEGLGASQIAGRLGSVTRNAVIGKAHRLGLSGRATTSRMRSCRASAARTRQQESSKAKTVKAKNTTQPSSVSRPDKLVLVRPAVDFAPPTEEMVIPLTERKTIQTLTECSCRWPIGDPQMADFHFCGKNKVPLLPYCEHHAQRAFQPKQIKGRSNAASPVSIPVDRVPEKVGA